jgi:hypothetical protein
MKLGAKGPGKGLASSMLGAVIAEDGLEGVSLGSSAKASSATSSAAAVVAAASAGRTSLSRACGSCLDQHQSLVVSLLLCPRPPLLHLVILVLVGVACVDGWRHSD